MITLASSIRSILAAIDGSDRAVSVFATAVMMATDLPARLFLVHVMTVAPDAASVTLTGSNGLEDTLEQDARRRLDDFKRVAPHVCFGPHEVVRGDPAIQILDISRKLNVDLIVIGGHKDGSEIGVSGAVGAEVVKQADRHVLVVHERPSVRHHVETGAVGIIGR